MSEPDHAAVYDAEVFADLKSVFGPARIVTLLTGLRREIDERLASPAADREQLGRDAHILVSVSGTLGFMPLSRACAELERACLGSGDLSDPLVRVQAAAETARRTLDGLTTT